MIEFIYLFLFRILSGGQNAFGYAEKTAFRAVASGVMIFALGGTAVFFLQTDPDIWTLILGLACIIVSILGTVGVEDGFSDGFNILPKDIHFWEILATGGITVFWMATGGNWIMIAASVYPSLIIHKGLINIGSEKGFWYEGTDDPLGRYFSIPLLGWRIKRLSLKTRLFLAFISLIVFALALQLGWYWSIR